MLHPSFELNCFSLQTRLFGSSLSFKTWTIINSTTTLKATILQRVVLISMYNETTDSFWLQIRLLTYFSCFFLFLRVCSFLLKLFIPLKCLNRTKKITFTLPESKWKSHPGNLMKKKTHFLWGNHNDFSSMSS